MLRRYNGVNRLRFVCAGRLRDFFRLCYTPSRTGGQNLSYIYWKFKIVRMVRKWCQSFVLCLCWQDMWFFSFVLHPFPKWGKNASPIYSENSKWSNWGESGLNHLCFVCAGKICDFFCLCYTPSRSWGQKPSLYIVKIQNCPIGAKMVSIVFASFVLEGCVIFSIVLPPGPTRGAKTPPIHSKNWK